MKRGLKYWQVSSLLRAFWQAGQGYVMMLVCFYFLTVLRIVIECVTLLPWIDVLQLSPFLMILVGD
jgi:hypothetical protein